MKYAYVLFINMNYDYDDGVNNDYERGGRDYRGGGVVQFNLHWEKESPVTLSGVWCLHQCVIMCVLSNMLIFKPEVKVNSCTYSAEIQIAP